MLVTAVPAMPTGIGALALTRLGPVHLCVLLPVLLPRHTTKASLLCCDLTFLSLQTRTYCAAQMGCYTWHFWSSAAPLDHGLGVPGVLTTSGPCVAQSAFGESTDVTLL